MIKIVSWPARRIQADFRATPILAAPRKGSSVPDASRAARVAPYSPPRRPPAAGLASAREVQLRRIVLVIGRRLARPALTYLCSDSPRASEGAASARWRAPLHPEVC
jgi:hypothetical protein